MLKNQRIPGLVEGTKYLRAKVVDMGETNALVKGSFVKVKRKKLYTVVKRRVIALETKLKEVRDAQKWSNEPAEEFKEQAFIYVAQLAASLQRVAKFE